MTSSPKPIMWRVWLSSSEFLIPLGVFALIWAHGAFLGLTDDEAYYWVLAQKPALGYAFHPPMVAWLIGLAQFIFRVAHPAVVRLPAALSAGSITWLAIQWMKDAGAHTEKLGRAALVLLSFGGFFGLSWMMVPDLPLFVGWTALFCLIFRICFRATPPRRWEWLGISASMAFALLSKYSAVLAGLSAVLCLLLWAPKNRRAKGIFAVVFGGILAAVPILIWNSQHEWGSLLYQLRDRHQGGGISWIRYGRFWATETLLAGPVLVPYALLILFRSRLKFREDAASQESRVEKYVALWILPALLVFCVQPLWADFKPHWAFIIWWPAVMALAYAVSRGLDLRKARIQSAYGIGLACLILISCYVPMGSWILERSVGVTDPRLDVTNDLYGWGDLGAWIQEKLGIQAFQTVFLGSRYQTAAQAAFALSGRAHVTLLPRDLKAREEWPSLQVSEGEGPEWPKLTQPVYYVLDNRYDEGPRYPGASCARSLKIEAKRGPFLAKWIEVWRCDPR